MGLTADCSICQEKRRERFLYCYKGGGIFEPVAEIKPPQTIAEIVDKLRSCGVVPHIPKEQNG